GLRSGFIYKTVPHVTLKSIANNPDIDEIWEAKHPAIEHALAELNAALRAGKAPAFKVTEGGRKGAEVDFSARANTTVKLPSGEAAPAGALLEWEVPFDFPGDWPASARAAFDAFHAARQAMQQKMDASITVHADTEILYDQPQVARDKLRISGPFTVEAVPFPTVLALEEAEQPQDADVAIARAGESARQHTWRDELLKTGIRGRGGQILKFATLETLPGTAYLHCTGTLAESGERVVVSFGPEYAALEQRQVQLALNEAEKLRPAPKFIVFASFTFDPEAAKDIDETRWPGVTLLKAQMNTDLLTEDLKKKRANNQSFWLMGQPEVELRRRKDGRYELEVHGFDYFDTRSGKLESGGKSKIALWLLDPDYDERSLFPRQVFFPMAGKKDGWNKLKRDIKAELDEGLLERFHGTVSLPFDAGDNRRVAIKIVDDRGIESLKILPLAD
ncbi:MAG: site-specific DNA-methyltransferase, partial [Rhodanobacteraceae bacterium]